MSSRELHYRYAISYLVVALVAAIGFGLFNVPQLVDKTNFALTITSLVLGVVAIIYTFIAGNKQDLQFAKLVEVSSSISRAAEETQVAAASLREQTQMIPQKLDSLGTKIDFLSQAGLPNVEREGQGAEQLVSTTAQLKQFVLDLPFAAMGALYLAVRAHMNGAAVGADMIARISPIPIHFFFGVLKTAEALGLLSISFRDEEITVDSVSDLLSNNIEGEINAVRKVVADDKDHILERLIKGIDSELAK